MKRFINPKKISKRTRRLLTAAVTAWLATACCTPAVHASTWETPEYFASNGLDLVNATAAYTLGYTGKGVRLGVCDDSVNFEHPEFSGKSASSMLVQARTSAFDDTGKKIFVPLEIDNWSEFNHGTHVAGIAAAARDDSGMHGAAFDAEIAGTVSVQYYDGSQSKSDPGFNVFEPYLSLSDVKVINNSWLGDDTEYINSKVSLEDFRASALGNCGDLMDAISAAADADKLLIFTTGNYGNPNPGLNAVAGLVKENAANHIISVTALDDRGRLSLENGRVSGPQLMGWFSDLACYAEDFTIAAPGSGILSANANFAADGKRDVLMSGTSMAAPFVTGGAALVQQAFPYLSAKQIGDVLLSTANADAVATNKYVVTMQAPGVINIFYTDPSVKSKSLNEQSDDVKALLDSLDKDTKMYKTLSETFTEYSGVGYYPICAYYSVPMQDLVGQGVLDLGKAVKGPAALNARRLEKSDVSDTYTVNGEKTKQALYTVDTAGYDSVWANDIREIRVGILAADSAEDDLRERYAYYAANWLDGAEKSDLKKYAEEWKLAKEDVDKAQKECDLDPSDEYAKDALEDAKRKMEDAQRAFNQAKEEYEEKQKQLEKATRWVNVAGTAPMESYIEEFNAKAEGSGLLGLHVGLLKTGEGTLTLSGANSYEGATVVRQGTLQINGSVAGDAWSVDDGILMGSGTIGGTLYNENIAIAGDGDGTGNLTAAALESRGTLVSVMEHGARAVFDEEGVTAAAYTFIVANKAMAMTKEMTFDRPFMFVIQNGEGEVLFAGIMNNPEAK